MIKANGNKYLNTKQKEEKIKKFEKHFTNILKDLGFDLNDQQIKDTPHRVAKTYVNELLSGCFSSPPKVTVFDNTEEVDNIVLLKNIQLNSLCSHHILPFTGKAHIAYIPDKKIIGLSKLARITDWFARRPQIQEELTKQIADYIEEKINPKGVAVIIEATHSCMTIRGAKQPFDACMKTAEMRGAFKQLETRNELYELIK